MGRGRVADASCSGKLAKVAASIAQQRGNAGRTRHSAVVNANRGSRETNGCMKKRELGKSGLWVSEVGLGCMGMSQFYDPKQMNDEESILVINHYLDNGGNFLDTADAYAMGRHEELVGKGIVGRRDRVVLATQFGNLRAA